MSTETHSFDDGKYTLMNNDGVLTALRHGELWPAGTAALVGDGLTLAMFYDYDELAAKAYAQEDQVEELQRLMECGDRALARAQEAVAAAEQRNAELERDAARYQLLRSGDLPDVDAGHGDIGNIYVWDQRGEKWQECGHSISGSDLDVALDAYLKPTESEQANEQ
jgi:hypothetical protein